nr:FeoA family protein [Nannocystis pusilla]
MTACGGRRQAHADVAFNLAQLELGARARVTLVGGGGSLALRLLEMGFTPGTVVVLIKRAPFGDPLELQVRGCHVSLRKAEAARIEAVPL